MKRLLTAAALAIAGPAAAADGIETPAYELMGGSDEVFEGGVAHRLYAPTLVAEVTVEAASPREASSIGFGPLASYIFGANAPGERIDMTAPVAAEPLSERQGMSGGDGEKIAMTAPVVTEPQPMEGGSGEKIDMTAPVGAQPAGGGLFRVRFHMPSKWTLETLPAPENPAVTFRVMPEREMVVAGYTGAESAEAAAEAEARARDWAAESGLTVTGPFERAGYDGPDTPAAERRWAVMAPVE